MAPQDLHALEQSAWKAFVDKLSSHLAAQWPAMPERLGPRYAEFVYRMIAQALKLGLVRAVHVARYTNLSFVWGPGFQDKPGFEWARALLAQVASAAKAESLSVHQLVHRSKLELDRMPESRIGSQTLAASDTALLDQFGSLGSYGTMLVEPLPLPPRAACDLEALELGVLPDERPQQYRLDRGEWHRVPIEGPAALRVSAGHRLPKAIGLLSPEQGSGPSRQTESQLRLRARTHAVCDGDVHPVLSFSGPHGRWTWAGHETRAVSWPVGTRVQPHPLVGPGCAIAEETSPELYRLDIDVCGLRDGSSDTIHDVGEDSAAVGSLQATVSAWPSAQWWLEVARTRPEAVECLPLVHSGGGAATRCRVERDGVRQDAGPLQQQFESGLEGATRVGLDRLAQAWVAVPGLTAPSLTAQLGLLIGRASCTWGWCYGASGLDVPALMRLVALLEMEACVAELQFGGQLALGASSTRIGLTLSTRSPLRLQLQRETLVPGLADVLQPATVRWRVPFELTLGAVANESACLAHQAGPLTGALVGEAGLRPCTRGGSGWEWFASLRVEPVSVCLTLVDPLLGQATIEQALLPKIVLLDWSLG